ncbi:gliding-associated putative ABC transporter substrate-binding component GldG [Lewinella aquimaris]|uniref:Gliding-associated putative ABC transporter substrate-binding component GldG n=1 Tax=Neolewinella aquimaris TaxID=1835722 RepID=A0A840E3Z4_9BACT|nr:gliding motility-associated ABC transporter substrate-binding protein GldG [Neolewinella aquimaris]MBB4077807.1 gliding-associated putative ABC transporter substrate-binding component GldG [Neolewinella aquimaris]
MSGLESKYRTQALVQLLLAVALLVVINVLANSRIGNTRLYGALDLTQDKRFTLTEHTQRQLADLDEPIYVRILLEGELPASYERLRTAVEETLEDFAGYTDYVEYEFVDPLIGQPDDVRQRQEDMLKDGIIPITDYQQSAGERTTKAIYPYALFYYGDRQRIVPLISSARPDVPIEQQLNQAENLLEYNFTRAIDGLLSNDKPVIGFTLGNGELGPLQFADLVSELRKDYEVGPVYLDSFATLPPDIDLLIVAKPTETFTDFEAFQLDQYVMNGGKVVWAIDAVAMDYDSLRATGEAYPESRTTGLEDLFFRYGFRLGNQLVLDLVNTPIPIATNQGQTGPKFSLVPFPYHVLALPQGDNPIVQNLDGVDMRYPTLIELVGGDDAVEETVLLASSDRARRQRLPSPIDLDAQKFSVDLERFNESDLPLAVLLRGTFSSPYANRLSRENERLLERGGLSYRDQSVPTSMIVISDGDVLANSVNSRGEVGFLGVNQFSKIPYANKTFMLNAVEYLLNPDGVIASRSKQVKLRLLDQNRALQESGYWRFLNLGVPLLVLTVFGLLFHYLRRRRYARP